MTDTKTYKASYDQDTIRKSFMAIANELRGFAPEFTKQSQWPEDIRDMHNHFGVHEAVSKFDAEKLRALLDFRVRFLDEELAELGVAVEDGDAEGVVDALVDLCVVAIGTLDLFQVDAIKSWDEVHAANMTKEVGVKPERPNELGLPDLVKPEGFVPPSHKGNHGLLAKVFDGRD